MEASTGRLFISADHPPFHARDTPVLYGTVVAKDGGGLQVAASLEVTVDDVNSPPKFSRANYTTRILVSLLHDHFVKDKHPYTLYS